MNSYFQHYCTGCGLCQSTGYTKLKYREDGFPYPENSSKDMDKFCDRVCPMGKYYLNLRKYNNPWGSYVDYYSGYSNNKNVRLKASSGGILTEICVALLKLNLVDAIIQTKYDEINPIETVTVVNRTEDEVLNCAGSRYAVSSPLIDINNIVSENKKYAFVGKPCDVAALRNYAEMNSTIKKSVIYYFSFFCAGTPSRLAANHPYNRFSMSPYFYNKLFGFDVEDVDRFGLTIGHDVWIGARTIITCSCSSIGNGAVIGAGSVVTKDVPPYSIVAGVPAKIIKNRFDKKTMSLLEKSRWFELSPEQLIDFYQYKDDPATFAKEIITKYGGDS